MTTFTMSQAVADTIGEMGITQVTYNMEDVSESTGASSTRVYGPPRWAFSIQSMGSLSAAQSVEWEMLMLKMRGPLNRLAVWDTSRPTPRGTMSGTLTLSSTGVLGAESLVITGGAGQAGKTLKMGDWLQVGTGLGTSQLVKVSADATANGSGIITVSIEPPLRATYSSGTSVTWNKPVAYFKVQGNKVSYRPDAGTLNYSGHALDLLEQWN